MRPSIIFPKLFILFVCSLTATSLLFSQTKKLDTTFIDATTLLFYDDFQGERSGEFPSKWTPVKGTVQNGTSLLPGEDDNVLFFSNQAACQPYVTTNSYLGSAFKLEMLVYFFNKSNERYDLYLYNDNNPTPALVIRTSIHGVKLDRNELNRVETPTPGWHRIQVSFNQGNLKVFYDGRQLINQPILANKHFDRLELHNLSSSSKGRYGQVNYFAIAEDALPLYERLVTEGRLVLRNINFAVNSFELQPESYPVLNTMATLLREHAELRLSIEGHTDADGSAITNQTLSEKRAEAVRAYLLARGIAAERLVSTGYGESRPLADGDTPAAKAENRRVEFVLLPQ